MEIGFAIAGVVGAAITAMFLYGYIWYDEKKSKDIDPTSVKGVFLIMGTVLACVTAMVSIAVLEGWI